MNSHLGGACRVQYALRAPSFLRFFPERYIERENGFRYNVINRAKKSVNDVTTSRIVGLLQSYMH